jgi:hypothetical protein
MSSPSSDFTELDQLVATYPEPIQALINATRAALLAAFPKAAESVDSKARVLGYGYGPGYKGTVATLILSKTGVKIGVPYGAQLADPAGLLTGQGKVHRHIPIEAAAQLKSSALEALLKAALNAWEARSALTTL